MGGYLINLGKKLYQIIISRLNGDRIHNQAYQEYIYTLVRNGIGGFIIFGGERDDVRAFIDKLQSMAEIPLFIASDIERGVGQQIEGCTNFPSQMAVRAAVNRDNPDDVAILRDVVRAISLEAIDAGINMPLIPVLDVNRNPDNPIICTRAFSDNPDDVSCFGAEYIKALEGLGLISCAKHFPGHGDTSIDSHISLPVITKSYGELMDMDIKPFIEAVKTGVSSIMAGHLHVPALDDSAPASLSKRVITDLLRKELGFDGLVMTDALNMSALAGIDNIAVRCVSAGVDILLHPADPDLIVKDLTSAVRSKLIDEKCIDTAVGRISRVKSRLRNITRVEVDYNTHNALSGHITDMSITLVKQKPGILPVTDGSKAHVVFAGDAAPTIFALFSEVAAWRGNSGMDNQEMEQIMELIKKAKNSIVISYGSPYILHYFKEADILIAAYDASKQSQEAVIKCLKGEIDFKGRLPVKLPD